MSWKVRPAVTPLRTGSLLVPLGQVLPRLLVGVQDQLVEVVVEEQRHDERDDQDERRPDDPGAQLAQVVGQRHPAVRADRVLRASPEEPGEALDQRGAARSGGVAAVEPLGLGVELGLALGQVALLGLELELRPGS